MSDLASYIVVLDTALVPLQTRCRRRCQRFEYFRKPALQLTSTPSVTRQLPRRACCLPILSTAEYESTEETVSMRTISKFPSLSRLSRGLSVPACGQGIGSAFAKWNVSPWKGLLLLVTQGVNWWQLMPRVFIPGGNQPDKGSEEMKQPSNTC
jgi:hypothetical protein